MGDLSEWRIFQGNREQHNAIEDLPDPPNWRKFSNIDKNAVDNGKIEDHYQKFQNIDKENTRNQERGKNFRIQTEQHSDVVDAVNAALYLRRPLLVTGKPGSGKTSLAYAVAYELKLGPVLLWPITARSTLQEGLYRYDAIARLQDAQLADKDSNNSQNIGEYIQLNSVGTAFLPSDFPRVLLIDEIDKSDINLPNDLLNLFEEGEFEIPELARLSKKLGDQTVQVRTKDDNIEAPIQAGRVRCRAFPFIIMTSNGERDFPPAFLRRCLRVDMPEPNQEILKDIVEAQLDTEITQDSKELLLIKDFVEKLHEGNNLAIDQLLNIIYLVTRSPSAEGDMERLKKLLLQRLTSTQDS